MHIDSVYLDPPPGMPRQQFNPDFTFKVGLYGA